MPMTNLLFVEDDPFISEIYVRKFESSGFLVSPALTGREALKKLREGSYDLVLLDMVIPELTGMEVLRELRTNRDFNPELKIIIFSNLSGPQERQEALAAGANGFISKTDFTPSEVVVEVRRYLDQFSSQAGQASLQKSVGTVIAQPTSGLGEDTPSGQEITAGKRILLVEDEPVFSEMFGAALREAGFTVIVNTNRQVDLEKARADGFHLLITDHVLPSSVETGMIATSPSLDQVKRLPIFLLTASLEDSELRKLETAGVVDRAFLKTQVTPSELAVRVTEFFAGQ